ncbi:MAG TPA: ABC transporter substrate-binding protein [Casimicrobiaceae bacterium]|jgi:putative ABC transport system substrate-binding protein
MDRRTFVSSIAGGLLAQSLAAEGQPAKIWRIGYLSPGARPADGAPPAVLRQALQELRYVDGQNVAYVGRWAEARSERLPSLATELVELKVDVIMAFGGKTALAAKGATSTIPVVLIGGGDLVDIGLVASLARPGGNVTGLSDQATELSAKRLELLQEAIPTTKRIAVLWNANDPAMTSRYREIVKAAGALRVTIQPLGVREPEDFDDAFSSMTRERPDALLLVTDSLTNLNRKRVLEFAGAHSLPAMYEYGSLVREGGLMSYGPDFDDLLRRAAVYIDKILRGAKPSDLPVEQPTKYYLLVNLRTAKSLGLTIPQSLLLRADELVQ